MTDEINGFVCGACGQPWTGEKCGQENNGWSYPVCYPHPVDATMPCGHHASIGARGSESDTIVCQLCEARSVGAIASGALMKSRQEIADLRAERDAWRKRESETQEELQAIGEEFGVHGGEPRTDGIRRILTELRNERNRFKRIAETADRGRLHSSYLWAKAARAALEGDTANLLRNRVEMQEMPAIRHNQQSDGSALLVFDDVHLAQIDKKVARLEETLLLASRTLASCHDRIHCLPRTSDTELAEKIEGVRAQIKKAIEP